MSLDSIVKVTISRQTSVPTRAGFGEGAFVAEGAKFQSVIKAYGDIDEVSSDVTSGFLDATALTAARRYFGQDNSPPKLYIIKKGAALVHVQTLTFSGEFVTGNVVDLDVDTVAVGPVAFNTNSDTTLDDVATAIAAEAGVATAVVNYATNAIVVTGATVGVLVDLENIVVTLGASRPTGASVTTQFPDTLQTYVQSITRAQLVNDDWYALAIQSKVNADQEAVADAVQPLRKLFFASSSDANILNPALATDIASELKAKSYDRSIVLYSSDSANHPEMSWMGGQLPTDPGSITWAYKQLKGAIVDRLNTTEKSAALAKNANTYTTIAGLNLTEEGKTTEGEFIDIMRGIDFITARIKESVFGLLANAPKVPFTDQGIASIENAVRSVLQLAVGQSIITESYTVTVPLAADVTIADKANRLLPNVRFNATLAGAIHKTEIQGTLTL